MDISKIQLPDNTILNLKDGRMGNAKIFHGTCSSEGSATAKIVDCADFTSENLVKGALIFVTFDETNSGAVASLTMNVNSTGAKSIKKQGNVSSTNNLANAGELRENSTYLFQYDGTNWVCMTLDYNSTYSALSEADMQAGTATTGRTISAARLKQAVEHWMAENQADWDEADADSPSYIANKPTLPTSPGTLNTTATTAQTTSASESLSGTINLHKVSKTGSYSDLRNRPLFDRAWNLDLSGTEWQVPQINISFAYSGNYQCVYLVEAHSGNSEDRIDFSALVKFDWIGSPAECHVISGNVSAFSKFYNSNNDSYFYGLTIDFSSLSYFEGVIQITRLTNSSAASWDENISVQTAQTYPFPATGTPQVVKYLYSKPSTGIPASDLASGVIPDTSNLVSKNGSTMNGNAALTFNNSDNDCSATYNHSGFVVNGTDDQRYLRVAMGANPSIDFSSSSSFASANTTRYTHNGITHNGEDFTFPSSGGTLALTSQIPNTSNLLPKSGGAMNADATLSFSDQGDVFTTEIEPSIITVTDLDDGDWYVKIDASGPYVKVATVENYYTLYRAGDISKKDGNNLYQISIPSKSGTFALTSDIPSAVTESTVSGWGFTKNAGTLTGVSFNGTSASVSNGVANITATIPVIHSGTSDPSSSLGSDGDIYIKLSS